MYGGLGETTDGVIEFELPTTSEENEISDPQLYHDWPVKTSRDQLTSQELKLIQRYHEGQTDRISFTIVEAKSQTMRRSYLGETPRLLASVTKLPTALAALESVRNVDVNKIRSMLKSSDNAEASRYVRLAARAIADFDTPGAPFTGASSCPSASRLEQEHPAANIVFNWVQNAIPRVDWSQGALKDGAGCDYGNYLTPLQLMHLLRYADQKGAAFNGMTFEELLSISGVDGTWKNRNQDAKGRVLAKTGTLRLASNLTGYFYVKKNNKLEKYYFSVLVSRSGSQSSGNARAMIEELVRYWLEYFRNHES